MYSLNQYEFMEYLLCVKYYTQIMVIESCINVMVPTHRKLTALERHSTENNLILSDKYFD